MSEILVGDCLSILPTLDAGSVQCCVTSPPYWGLRDYGVAGQFGLERTPDEYVARMVEVFREVRRVLRDDGTLWLNLGDCYATGAGKVGEHPGGGEQGSRWAGSSPERGERCRALRDGSHAGKHTAIAAMGPMTQPNRMPIEGLKPKDMVGIPWRVAFALQADGWYLRADCIWHKPNAMPESVRDRPTKAHEYVFLLAKSERYYYDHAAIAEPSKHAGETVTLGEKSLSRGQAAARGVAASGNGTADSVIVADTRNCRSVWTITTKPYSGAHFATMPPDLAERCILAGCPVGGIVLDPFFGAGTVGLVAQRLRREYVGIELNPAYADLARERIREDCPLFSAAGVDRRGAGG